MTALQIISSTILAIFIIVEIYRIVLYYQYNAKVNKLAKDIQNNRAEQMKRIDESIKYMKGVNMDKIKENANEYYGVKK